MADVVRNSARQRQCEQAVGEREVDQINSSGVELLLSLADNIENQRVAECTDDKND